MPRGIIPSQMSHIITMVTLRRCNRPIHCDSTFWRASSASGNNFIFVTLFTILEESVIGRRRPVKKIMAPKSIHQPFSKQLIPSQVSPSVKLYCLLSSHQSNIERYPSFRNSKAHKLKLLHNRQKKGWQTSAKPTPRVLAGRVRSGAPLQFRTRPEPRPWPE